MHHSPIEHGCSKRKKSRIRQRREEVVGKIDFKPNSGRGDVGGMAI